MKKINYIRVHSFLTIVTFIVLMASLYLQYFMNLQPCPLCIMQRVCLFILLIILGVNFRTQAKAHILSGVHVLVACAGLYFAARQLWLQSLPPEKVPACMPGLDVLLQYFPWKTILHALFWGAGDCAEVGWTLWGISIPGWSALYFLFMLFAGLFLFLHTRKTPLEG